MSIRVVWDTSALLAYVAGDTRAAGLGELLATVEEGGDVTGVPAVCLVAAYRGADADQHAKLVELTSDDDGPTVILPLLAADVAPVAELTRTLPIDQAQAVTAASRHGALLATYERPKYAGAVDDDDMLDL
ncbi:MAG TPA: hypothetical protein VFM55_04940 [Micromonosporaceae bacterium]|nr:hypothetical protein [Micromonosporaceae bacterium]